MKSLFIGLLFISTVFGNIEQLKSKIDFNRMSRNRAAVENGYTHQLDSFTIEYLDESFINEKFKLTRDDLGNIIAMTICELLDGEWVNTYKAEITYYDSGNDKDVKYYIWQDENWLLESSYEVIEYDSFGNSLLIKSQSWLNGEVVGSSKTDRLFDESGNEVSKKSYELLNEVWLENGKSETSYNNLDKILSLESYSMVDGKWQGGNKYEHTYDESGKEVAYLSYLWRDSVWSKNYKYEYTYDESGYQLSRVKQLWKDETWVISSKMEYSSDDSGNLLKSTGYNLDSEAWVIDNEIERTYNEDGKVLTILHKFWIGNEEPIISLKNEYTYDIALSNSRIPDDWWFTEDDDRPVKTQRFTPNAITGEWENTQTEIYHYSSLDETAIMDKGVAHTNSGITVSVIGSKLNFSKSLPRGTSLALFNLSGKKVLQQRVKGRSISLPSMAKGLYIARVKFGTSVVLQKISVR
jgi:hypothetical protein